MADAGRMADVDVIRPRTKSERMALLTGWRMALQVVERHGLKHAWTELGVLAECEERTDDAYEQGPLMPSLRAEYGILTRRPRIHSEVVTERTHDRHYAELRVRQERERYRISEPSVEIRLAARMVGDFVEVEDELPS